MKKGPLVDVWAGLALLIAVGLFPHLASGQGSLTPSSGPAPVMKSLDQIASQGIPLNSTNTPGDATNHFIVSQPGAYYLTGNLSVAETEGIRITAAGVTIDLNGFQISTTNAAPDDGVTIRPGADHCVVKNGSLVGFAQGIDTITQTAKNCLFLNVAVSGCTNWGIRAGEGAVLQSCHAHDCSGASAAIGGGVGSTLRDCTASHNSSANAIQASAGSTLVNCTTSNNTGTNAISVGNGSTLTNCAATVNTVTSAINAGAGCTLTNCSADSNTATNGFNTDVGSSLHNCSARLNTGVYGFNATTNCSFMNCTASNNASSASVSAGFNVGSGCSINHCVASNQTTTAGTSTNQTGIGFQLNGEGCKIEGCTAFHNNGDGIFLTGGAEQCYVIRNICTQNSRGSTTGAEIHVFGGENRIDGNRARGGAFGILVDGIDALVIRNSANGGAAAYKIANNNRYGTIVDLTPVNMTTVNGASAPSTVGTTDPWANFSY